ncbi:hypothetical protein PENSPDRAFT_656824 [Peniophora sp. CONT]|nr:hypothetical protein PENSPDRAFT_656824 [Peniophora sp. CONT]
MDDLLGNMQSTIQDALDGVVSARSSTAKRSQSLDELEQVLAKILVRNSGSGYMETFQFLQDTFECNIPSRLIDWTCTASLRLDHLLSRGMSDSDKGTEAATLSSHIIQALSLIQGVALVHHRSKVLLGGKHAQEVLVDLLWASRHSGYPDTDGAASSAQATPTQVTPVASKPKSAVSLSSAVLDTLLCILVDSSPALRTFEKVGGVKTVVNLVKRPKALRDAKMKCLEFLYFYLLDESSPNTLSSSTSTSPAGSLQASPTIESRSRRVGRDASWGSNDSHSSNSSQSSSFSLSSSTSATSFSSVDRSPRTPPRSPTTAGAATPRRPFAKPRALLLLQKDVDYTPLSPKKSHSNSRVPSSRYGTPLKAPNLGVGIPSSPTTPTASSSSRRPSEDTSAAAEACNPDGTRSTEQKKEYLGTMLGNVEALVAGVRSAAVAFTA